MGTFHKVKSINRESRVQGTSIGRNSLLTFEVGKEKGRGALRRKWFKVSPGGPMSHEKKKERFNRFPVSDKRGRKWQECKLTEVWVRTQARREKERGEAAPHFTTVPSNKWKKVPNDPNLRQKETYPPYHKVPRQTHQIQHLVMKVCFWDSENASS